MYGMINRAVQELVTNQFGETTWQKIAVKAGCEGVEFARDETYPDELTYSLVAATSQVLGMPTGRMLRVLGRYWTQFSADAGYDEMLESTGKTFGQFLSNLEEVPVRVAELFPRFDPPAFEAEELEDGTTLVHYYSARPGLAPMMHGLLEGIAERFGVEVQIAQVRSVNSGSGHDVFQVRTPAAA